LIAAVPAPPALWGELTKEGRGLLEELGVRVVPIENEFGRARPITNKIWCLLIPTDADKLVFLDSDVLCMREFHDEARFALPFNATPSGVRTPELWVHAYGTAGVPLPSVQMPTMVSRELGLPYFSAGFVGVNSDVPLGEAWLECHRALVADDTFPATRFEEQVSLALAVQKLELGYDCLDERYNYPLRHKPIDAQDPPYFCHYGRRPVAQHEPAIESAAASLVQEHPALLDVMKADEEWVPLARHFERRRSAPAASEPVAQVSPPSDLVLTGIAASGAGYLSELFGGYSNCLVLIEPGGRVDVGLRLPVPGPVAVFYRLERVRILDDGLAAEPAVESNDFVFATTHTHSYLSRLEGLHRVMPHARIIVCVRDPFDTIASWKRHADGWSVEEILDSRFVPKPDDPWLTGAQRQTISQLRETVSPTQVMAVVWQHFAELVLNQSDRVLLVTYEDLVRNPQRVLAGVLDGLNGGEPRVAMSASVARSDRSNLTDRDEQVIRATCSQAAFDLGLWR
jgi:hypothetical protein